MKEIKLTGSIEKEMSARRMLFDDEYAEQVSIRVMGAMHRKGFTEIKRDDCAAWFESFLDGPPLSSRPTAAKRFDRAARALLGKKLYTAAYDSHALLNVLLFALFGKNKSWRFDRETREEVAKVQALARRRAA